MDGVGVDGGDSRSCAAKREVRVLGVECVQGSGIVKSREMAREC